MKMHGEELADKKKVEKVLISLPERFEAKVSALEERKDLNTLMLSELIGSLQAHEPT